MLGEEEDKKWRAAAVDRSAISERMKKQWADARDRCEKRAEQIAAMSDRQLVSEIRRQQGATWRTADLLEHVKKHQRKYTGYAGHAVGPDEIRELSRLTLMSWDRLFSSLNAEDVISYAFLARWQASDVLLT